MVAYKNKKILIGVALGSLLVFSPLTVFANDKKEELYDSFNVENSYESLSSSSAESIEGRNVLNFNRIEILSGIEVVESHYSVAPYLKTSSYYLMPTYKAESQAEEGQKLHVPSHEDVVKIMDTLLRKIELLGVDTEAIAQPNGLSVMIINAEMDGILGHALMKQPKPAIHLYGSFQRQIPYSRTETTLYHEMGHYIEELFFTSEEKEAYRQMRGIKDTHSTPSHHLPWEERFQEVFAEDFRLLFQNLNADPHTINLSVFPNRTKYGNMDKEQSEFFQDLVVSVMKRSFGEIEVSKSEQFILMNRDKLGFPNNLRAGHLSYYTTKDVPVHFVVQNLHSHLSSLHKDFNQYVSKQFIEDALKSEGLNKGSNAKLDKKKIKKVATVIEKAVKEYTKIKKKEHWLPQTHASRPELNQAMDILQARGVINAKEDVQNLNTPLTRKDAGLLLYNASSFKGMYTDQVFDKPSYRDVDRSSKYFVPLETLKAMEVMMGYGTNFGANDLLTREQMSAILNRYYLFTEVESNGVDFKDKDFISPLFRQDINALASNGIIVGNQKAEFMPKSNVTKGQFYLMLNRSFLNSANQDDIKLFAESYHSISSDLEDVSYIKKENEDLTYGEYINILFKSKEE